MPRVLIPLANVTTESEITLLYLELSSIVAIMTRWPGNRGGKHEIALLVSDDEGNVRRIDLADSEQYPVADRLDAWASRNSEFEQFSYLGDSGAIDYRAKSFVRRGRATKFSSVRPEEAEAYWVVYVEDEPAAAIRQSSRTAKQSEFADGWNDAIG